MTTRLDSRALALFLAVAETQNFRQAAETLHMSQPPLSRSIRLLEERLGVALFNRNTHGVHLTAAGQKLLPYARQVAALLRNAERALIHATPLSTLRLGITSSVQPAWFGGLTDKIQATQPGTKLTVIYDTSPRLVRQLRAGKLDTAIIALPTEARGFSIHLLGQEPMIVAMQSAHRLARRRAISLAELSSEPLFWFERARQPAFYDHCQQIFLRHGFAPRILKEPQDHHVLLNSVAAGRGMALLPCSLAELKQPGVSYRKLREGEELSVGIGLVASNDHAGIREFLLMVLKESSKRAANTHG